MAIYEVQCTKCEHVWEIIQKYEDPLPEKCPECDDGPIIRLMSAGGWQVDWYGGY